MTACGPEGDFITVIEDRKESSSSCAMMCIVMCHALLQSTPICVIDCILSNNTMMIAPVATNFMSDLTKLAKPTGLILTHRLYSPAVWEYAAAVQFVVTLSGSWLCRLRMRKFKALVLK